MLKLETVLCAGVFFGLVLVTTPTILSLDKEIKIMTDGIEKRMSEIHTVKSSTWLRNEHKDFESLQAIAAMMGATLEQHRDAARKVLIRPLIPAHLVGNCSSDLSKYYEEHVKWLKQKDDIVNGTVYQTMNKLDQGLEVCTEGLQKLKALKEEAKSCNECSCDKIVKSAHGITRHVLKLTCQGSTCDKIEKSAAGISPHVWKRTHNGSVCDEIAKSADFITRRVLEPLRNESKCHKTMQSAARITRNVLKRTRNGSICDEVAKAPERVLVDVLQRTSKLTWIHKSVLSDLRIRLTEIYEKIEVTAIDMLRKTQECVNKRDYSSY